MAVPRSATKSRSKKQPPVTWDVVRELALALPGAELSSSYGTPAIKIRGQLMARLKEDGESFVLRCDFADRELLITEQPEIFFITDHYLNYPWVLVRLATVRHDQLDDLLRHAHRDVSTTSKTARHSQKRRE